MDTSPNLDALLARYLAGPELLERAIDGMQDAALDALPLQGGWTIRQIAHHIVDGDDLWKTCLKAALGNEQGVFSLAWYSALPQREWADRWAYAQRSLDVSLNLFKANRAHVHQLLDRIPDGWHRAVGFQKAGGETVRILVREVIEDQADHAIHHVDRILAIRQEHGCV